MSTRITKLSVQDFRSIRGTLDLDIDAPVVLIHGPNGSGKTSLLSALELGLTGVVSSFDRFDNNYVQNLVHFDADEAKVSISCRHPLIENKNRKLLISKTKIRGEHLLSSDLKKFFSERSFLAQSTLSRLLEIYEHADTRTTDSPLTQFVKDLLGLDALDHIISGLHAYGDKRRLRRSLPLFEKTEKHIADLNNQIASLREEQSATTTEIDSLSSIFAEHISALPDLAQMSIGEQLESLSLSASRESSSTELRELRREVNSAEAVLEKFPDSDRSAKLEDSQRHLSEVTNNYEEWIENKGHAVDNSIRRACDITSFQSENTVGRRAQTLKDLKVKLERDHANVREKLQFDINARKALASAQEELNKLNSRASRLNTKLEELFNQSGQLAQLLSELNSYIEEDICPVCHRDFSEVSETSLHSHVSHHIGKLTQVASQIAELTEERKTISDKIRQQNMEISSRNELVLTDQQRISLNERSTHLQETINSLDALHDEAEYGDELYGRVQVASYEVNRLHQTNEALAGLRLSVKDYARRLNLAEPNADAPIAQTLANYLTLIDKKISHQNSVYETQLKALNAGKNLVSARRQKTAIDNELNQLISEHRKFQHALRQTDTLIKEAKQLSGYALETRTDIVRHVFNESLNQTWKDLFIRLAPEEPFIPAFCLPSNSKGPVEAKLETKYRKSSTGGNPKAMLSAGNLNTAALTLFLALHLSVPADLPWLVIDDPVQSMDEIHIAQFAGLIRTLAKQQNRQVILAVHEKPLFDYLKLELSPSFEGDRLATIELSKDGNGNTSYDAQMVPWDPKRVLRMSA